MKIERFGAFILNFLNPFRVRVLTVDALVVQNAVCASASSCTGVVSVNPAAANHPSVSPWAVVTGHQNLFQQAAPERAIAMAVAAAAGADGD